LVEIRKRSSLSTNCPRVNERNEIDERNETNQIDQIDPIAHFSGTTK
jgi:hypothetical protein